MTSGVLCGPLHLKTFLRSEISPFLAQTSPVEFKQALLEAKSDLKSFCQ